MALPSKEYDCDGHTPKNTQTVTTESGKIYGFCRRCDRRFQFDQQGNIIAKTRMVRAQEVE